MRLPMQFPASPALSRRAMLRGLGAAAGLAGFSWSAPSALATSGTVPEAAWPGVTALLDRYVSQRKLAGIVATFGWGEGPLGSIARGSEGFDDGDPVGPASLFRIYSMTKPITGMAAAMLIEEGKLGLDQPLADFLPEFAQPRVALDPFKGLDSRPAQKPITIRHMLTHTAGFGYAGIGRDKVSEELLRQGVTPAVVSRMVIPGLTPPVPTPGENEFLHRAASVPLLAEPGTRWRYSMSLDILGLVVERASGARSFGEFLRERIFEPAGMASSFFHVPKSEAGRLATNYGMVGGIAVPIDKPANSVFFDQPAFDFGGAGLVATPVDYDRFLQLLVNKGRAGSRQVISEKAVAMGMSNLLPEGADTRGTQVEGAGFGAGGRVGLGVDQGTFGWSGAAGTIGFVNTRIGLRAGLYVQFMPPEAYPLQREFLAAVREDALKTIR